MGKKCKSLTFLSFIFLIESPFIPPVQAQTRAVNGEFMTDWLLLGPLFPNDLDRDFLASAGGEANAHPTEGDIVITTQGDTLRWKRYRSIGSIIDLDHAIGDYDNATLYAFCILQSDRDGKMQFVLGSNDGVAVWINGEQVHRNSVFRDITVDEDTFAVDLKAGANRCLVKITEIRGTWEFAMRAYPYDRPVAATPTISWWENSIDNLKLAFWFLRFNWKYHPGDNPEWAGPDFDDRHWQGTHTLFAPHKLPGDWNGIGWFRLHLAVDSTLWNRPLALNLWLWGAAEIYLDGALLAQYGKVGLSMSDEEGHVAQPELNPPRSIVFGDQTDHVIAIRYSNFFLLEKAPNIWHGFRVVLRDLDSAIASSAEQRRTNTNMLMITTTVPIVFAVLHLLLFLFYRRATENLYYALLTLAIGAMSFFGFQYRMSFMTDLRQAYLYHNLSQILLLFTAVAGLRFLYAIFYPRLPRQLWVFLFIYIAVVIWIWDNPFHTEDYANWFAATTILEMLRIIVVAILRKKDGAWIIGAGMMFMAVLFGSSIVLTGIGILPATLLFEVTLPVLGIAGLLLSMSFYLARHFAQTNENLQAQLAQVNELSAKTLQQELERAKLQHELELEHLQAEKLQGLDQLKSRFFANISHEFRTPLTLILGTLEKFLSDSFEESVRKQFRVMLRNGRRLLRLINQLLDLSRLEAGSMSLKAGPENIIPFLKGIVLSFSSLAERRKIALRFQPPQPSKGLIVYVDRDKLEKIVFNLLSNAFKFTPEGGEIAVRVSVHPPHSSPTGRRGSQWKCGFVEIMVSDSGLGIPPEELQKVFDRFYQANDSYAREHEGSGIGLALTKELVELHRGEIEVISEPGKRTTFTVCLPLGTAHLQPEEIVAETRSFSSPLEQGSKGLYTPSSEEILQDAPAQEPASGSEPAEGNDSPPIVLIIEDNADVRSYICDYLDHDYQIREAVDGEEGFEKSVEMVPDLIISDVMMPGIDGYELCRRLKTDERTSHIPIVLLTARASGESKVEGLQTGADDYITKPFDACELQVRVKNLIEQRRKLRERFRKEVTLQPKDVAITSMDAQFLQRAMEVIEENLSDPEFSTDLFARKVAMSRMQLHRKLRALTGQSTHEFLRTYRLQRAAQLLQYRAGTVTEICYDVGFNSLSHFARVFRKQFGQSPSEFAARHS
ncbi:MAG: ATP-binding protein [bacterium]